MVVRRLSEMAELPSWAPGSVRDLWELARRGEIPAREDEAQALAELDHEEFAVLWARKADLPDRFRVGDVNPRFHVQIHRVIETQLLQDDPPGVRLALVHLLDLGIDRHTAVHLIMEGLLKDIHTALSGEQPSGYGAFLERLRRARIGAPGAAQPKVGRNDSCPCGSGKKHKRCCGAEGPGPTVAPRSAGMCLGHGFYAGPGWSDLSPGHPLITLENLSAVAHALEDNQMDAAAREAYQRLVAAAARVGEGDLNNALQEQMEFAMNHPQYVADGIEAATRLMSLPFNRDHLDMLSVDLADFYDIAGDPQRAEALYRETLARDTKEPYVYLRWARRLADLGRTAEARAAYQTVIDRRGMGDPEALREARQESAAL